MTINVSIVVRFFALKKNQLRDKTQLLRSKAQR
jgi:hypothetical protein